MNSEKKDSTNSENDLLHGVTLKMMLTDVIDYFGHDDIFGMTEIRCFDEDYPQFNRILKFLRKTPWARDKIEKMYRGNVKNIAAMRRDLEQPKKSE